MFVNDVRVRDALYAAFTLSSEEHARITSIDLRPAMQLQGVVAAITAADVGPTLLGRSVRDYPVLASDRVLYMGQRVAAVAAVDPETARRAADLVEVEYEPLPPLRSPAEAIAEGAALLHPDYERYEGAVPNLVHPNQQGRWLASHGDAAAAFSECDCIFEATYTVPRSHSAALEPHSCIVIPDGNHVHVYSSHKAPYELRRDLALLSGRPTEEFTVYPAHIGGDFGSKGFGLIEGPVYFLAMRTRQPVRCTLSFYEVLAVNGARHPATISLKTGIRAGGMHTHQTRAVLDGGAYAGLKAHPMAVVNAIRAAVEPYDVPNVDESCDSFYSNSLPGSHVRSPGEFQAVFAGESHVDSIARALSIDPIEFRIRNSSSPRQRRLLTHLQSRTTGWSWGSSGRNGRGVGVAVAVRDAGPGSTTASCRAARSGTIEITLATPDQGAGSYAAFRRLAARELGVSEEAVSIRVGTTDTELADSGAGASRVTSVAGRATIQACRALLDQLGGRPEGSQHGWIGKRLDVLGKDEMEASGAWTLSWPPADGMDIRSYGAAALEVEVHPETGVFEIKRVLVIVDTGSVVNPTGHRGQVEGGFIYGLSQATLENLLIEQGQVVTVSLGDYRIMSAADIPPIEIDVLETDEDYFHSIRSVGEVPNVLSAPALANAVEDAVGVRLRDLPITPEAIRRALDRLDDAGATSLSPS
jgi:CO/xanthine dehydrogenase Mo-binding subunit